MGKIKVLIFKEDGGELAKLLTLPSDVPINQTFFVFDFDYTLSFMPIIEHNGKLVRSIKAELRGGDATLQSLQKLKNDGASFAILSAKANGKFAVESIALRLKPLGLQELFNSENVRGEEYRENQMLFAFAGPVIGSGHNKPEGLMFYMKKKQISPQHLVFVDDCADNVLGMYHYFQANPTGFDITLIWWPVPIVEGFQGKQRESTDPEAEFQLQKLEAQTK